MKKEEIMVNILDKFEEALVSYCVVVLQNAGIDNVTIKQAQNVLAKVGLRLSFSEELGKDTMNKIILK